MSEFRAGYAPEYYETLRAARARQEAGARAADRLMREAAEVRHVADGFMLRPIKPGRFTLREEHLALLRAAFVSWGNDAPMIDQKRPYGSSGDIGRDVARILGWSIPDRDEDESAYDAMCERAEILHRETEEALQIVLALGAGAAPGEYELSERYDRRSWRRMADVPD